MHLKQAYEMGVQLALEEAGLVKEASRFRQWLAQHVENIVGGDPLLSEQGLAAIRRLIPKDNLGLQHRINLPETAEWLGENVGRNTLDKEKLISALTPRKPGTGPGSTYLSLSEGRKLGLVARARALSNAPQIMPLP